jgi:tRNA(Ile)-lysidine synthase
MAEVSGSVPDTVAEILTRYSMLPRQGRVGVAVSGGADSVVLLHLLQQYAVELTILHVNHHLRGAESDADEEFVRELAARMGLAAVVCHASELDENLEQAARLKRREFFLRCMTECRLDRVALGHTRSDQAETVLFRLLRGSGLTGLAAMAPQTPDGLIRPLLGCSRDQVRQWGLAQGLRWREDGSNEERRFTRNRLRIDTLPALAEQYNPQLEATLAGTAKLALAEEDYWNQQIEPLYREITERSQLGLRLPVNRLSALHPAVGRRLLRRAFLEVRGNLRSLDLQHVDAVLRLAASEAGHDRVQIPGVDALRSFGTLLLAEPGVLGAQPRQYCLALTLGERCELPYQAGIVSVNWIQSENEFCANFKEETFSGIEVSDLDGQALISAGMLESLHVRNWRPGDELHRKGHQAREKIKEIFQAERILLWERKHWPVVVAGEEIVWARQFGGAARFQVSVKGGWRLRLTYQSVPLSERQIGPSMNRKQEL